ncbi:MAG: DUF2341 domain-containing protein, partial [Kiritimatiellae bacterium]|nr:DUF2341 domain-containing protein [Kiritimatiellia bacterium]
MPGARAAVPADFAKTFTVTVPGGLADETLTSFPLLLRLGTSIDGFDYADFRQDGADILITDASGNALPYELENWDTNGESRLWVRVPSVAEGTTLAVYYGTEESVAPSEGMWSGYAGVWHFNEAGDGATTIADSTANGQNGTSHASSKARSDGKLGAARGLEQNGKNGAMTTVPSSAVLDALVPTFTVSGWVRPTTLSLNWGYLFARKTSDADPSWGLQFRGKDGNSDSVGIYSNGNADNDSNRAVFSTSGKFTANTWTKYHVVYDSTTIRLYLDGVLVDSKNAKPDAAVSKSNGFGIGGFPTSANHSTLKADQDEVRLMNGAVSAAWVVAEYRQETRSVALSYGEVQDTDATAPVVAVPALSRDPATGAFTVSAELSKNVPVSVVCDADGVTNAMTTADSSLPMTYSATLAGLAANTTYACLVAATSTGGTVTEKASPTAFYTGDLSVVKISDANENGLVTGVFRISRADTAHDLTVTYTVGGTATAGQTYAALPGTATIPAGSTHVDVEVVPLLDSATTENTTVSLALAAGLYGVDAQAGSAEMTVENLVVPAGFNTWVAAADGLASVGSNWSEGHAPLASENVLFDGRFSSANCEWDAAATATVASWTQTNGYSGVVTLDTVYPGKGAFTCLTVTGPMAVMSGAITHPLSRSMGENHPATWDWVGDLLANETYRLRLAVGSLTVGAGGLLDAKGKGYRVTHNSTKVYASHGGRASQAAQRCYGDPKEPIHIGLADKTQGNGGYYNGKGGGAIYVTSSGPVVVDGTVRADSDREGTGCCGAAGSVYLNAPSVSGSGRISAYGPGSGDGNYKGTGGRVAIVTDEPVNRATFSAITADSDRKSKARYGGAGTVFFKDRTRPNGLLVVGSPTAAPSFNWDQIYATASVTTDGDWTFDAVELGSFGFLVVPAGTTLTLPNGLASCTGVVASASAVGGIRYEGGTLDIGSGPQTIAGNWMFCAWSNYVFHADVTVKNGGLIGVHPINERVESGTTLPAFVSCDLAVDGDLTVESTGAIVATDCGFRKNRSDTHNGVLGFHSHGGRTLRWGRPDARFYEGYDSIFSPRLPGCSVP